MCAACAIIYSRRTVVPLVSRREKHDGRDATRREAAFATPYENRLTRRSPPVPLLFVAKQVDPHRSHLTSSAVMLWQVPEDTKLERDADVALEDKALIGAWSDLRA